MSSASNKRNGDVGVTGCSSPKRAKKCIQPHGPFDLLTDGGMLFPIFAFIGPYHFRFVASVSRRWRRLYTQFQQNEYRKREQRDEGFDELIATTITSTASIAESTSRAEIFLSDTRTLTSPFRPIKILKNGSQLMKRDFYTPRSLLSYLRDSVAVRYGSVEILQLVTAKGCTCDNKDTCASAAENGHLDVLRWLRTKGCPWDECTCIAAAAYGHLDVLQWARENGCLWHDETCSYAAQGGYLEVLQWARENGCPWDEESICEHAALGGKLDVLQWLRTTNGCPWDEWTCSNAALGGYLEVLQWSREKGCPWDESTCSSAAEFGHLEVLQWARENGCPWD